MAWRVPPVMAVMANVQNAAHPQPVGSMVPWAQTQLFNATRHALAAVAQDVTHGLAETVGLHCEWDTALAADERCSVILRFPGEVDAAWFARAIDLENVEAWCDDQQQVRVAIGPWYAVKDADQVVLAITKVVHVKLGMHAVEKRRA